MDLLPSCSSLEELGEANSFWWLLRAQCFHDYNRTLLSDTTTALSKSPPSRIARAILWVVIALQQLPRESDLNSLELLHHPSKLIAKCVNTVTRSISSDETLVSSLDGLECLVLQGIFYNNDGKLQSAWLSYRRALNVAQIIGLHRLTTNGMSDTEFNTRAKHIWHHIIFADRYLSTMLGMYHGISDTALDSQKNIVVAPNATPMEHLCRIAGLIIERNQRFSDVTPSMVRVTQTIDSELSSIDIPLVVDDSVIPSSGTSSERVQYYDPIVVLSTRGLASSSPSSSVEHHRSL